jgi:hypothetical protein
VHSKRLSRRRLPRPLTLAVACVTLALPAAAIAGSGGTGPATGGGGGGAGGGKCTPKGQAQLRDGRAIPPCSAPARVAKVIRAANEIAKGKGYCYGGGHASFKDNCYDCSGSVSYALHGGSFVDRPMPSSGYFRWGRKGRGRNFTVYTQSSHMYLVVEGLRFDTSMTAGKGPGWSKSLRSSNGFRARQRAGF